MEIETLEDLRLQLIEERKIAVEGRQATGIEQIWQEDEEACEGIDDMNREEVRKGLTLDTGLIRWKKHTTDGVRSTAFLNITRPYVNIAASRLCHMLLPTDELPQGVEPTPKSDVRYMMEMVNRGMLTEEQLAMVGQSEAENKAKVEAAKIQIKDWWVECQWHAEARKCVLAAAKIGTGVLKGPIPEKRNYGKLTTEMMMLLPMEEQYRLLYRPGTSFLSAKNLYPDPGCGEDIQEGSFCFELMEMAERKFLALAKDQTYNEEEILACVEEGPKTWDNRSKGDKKKRPRYDVWLRWGMVPGSLLNSDEDEVFAMCYLCNDRLIKVFQAPLDCDKYPYSVFVWQEREGVWFGIGVARQIETPQRGLNASLRKLLDNSSLGSGPQLISWEGLLRPQDGRYEIYPLKHWFANPENGLVDMKAVRDALMTIDIPMHVDELLAIINFFLSMAEQSTGISLLLQGLSTAAEDTLGGMQMKTNAASTVLRDLARNFDDRVIEPQLDLYYEWIKTYGPETANGDIQIDARGSVALVDRDIQVQAMTNLLPLAKDPAYRVSPNRLMKLFLQAQRFDYESVAMDEEEFKAAMEAAAQPPYQVDVAQIGGEVDKYIAELRSETEKFIAQLKTQSQAESAGLKAGTDAMKIRADVEKEKAKTQQMENKEKEKDEQGMADQVISSLGL